MTKVNSLLKYAEDFSDLFTDPRILADIGYVDSKIASLNSALRLKGTLNGSSGTITPPATGETGDTYYITSAPATGATLFGATFRNGDAVVVSTPYTNNPSVANFIFLEQNNDLASTTVAGLIQIATQAIANAGTDSKQAITALTLAGYLANGLYTKKFTALNPLIPKGSGGNWTIPNTLASDDVLIQVKEVSTGDLILAKATVNPTNIIINLTSKQDIPAGIYKLIAIGI